MDEKVEIGAVIRSVNAVALRNAHNYIDYKTVMLKLAEVVTDGIQRGRLIACVKWFKYEHLKFCCIVSVLGLLDIEKRYCADYLL